MEFQNLKKFRLPADLRGKPAWFVQAWWIIQMLLFKTSPQFMYGWRRFLLRCFGAKIGKGVIIRPTTHIQFPWKLEIGDHSWIGDEVVLYNLGPIKIGNHSVVSQRSYLCTGSHDHDQLDFSIYVKPINIESECWLAADVFVAPGMHIGHGTVVGSRSSVFKSLPAGKICYGNPAVVIKNRERRDMKPEPVIYSPLYESQSLEMWPSMASAKALFKDL